MATLQQPKRRRRCQLAVPADSWHKIEKAAASGVDHVFLDLEDAVAPQNKAQARQNIIKAFNELDWGETVRCFRMNGLDCEHAYQDLVEVIEGCGQNVDTVLVPKVMAPRDVHFVENMLQQLEWKIGRKDPIGIEMLIEEVEGAAYCVEIATASPRVECLIFGVGDYTRAQGVDIRDAFGKAAQLSGRPLAPCARHNRCRCPYGGGGLCRWALGNDPRCRWLSSRMQDGQNTWRRWQMGHPPQPDRRSRRPNLAPPQKRSAQRSRCWKCSRPQRPKAKARSRPPKAVFWTKPRSLCCRTSLIRPISTGSPKEVAE